MQDQRAVQEVIATHRLRLRCVKEDISALNEHLALLSVQEQDLASAARVLDVKSSMDSINSDMQSTRSTLLSKTREQLKLEDILELHRSVLTPAHLLPFEIWVQIFFLCMPETRYPRWDTHFTPVILERVCSRWRSMTRLIPELWSSISLDILPGIGNKQPRWMPLIHAFLNRSGNRPLSIQIVWFQSKFELNQRTYRFYLLDLVISSSIRWKDLDIIVPSDFLHRFTEANMPLLETFTVGSDATPPLILHAPRLRSVIFSGLYTRPSNWDLSWDRLIELRAKNLMGYNGAKGILRQCPRLQCFELRISWNSVTDPLAQASELVTLRELRSFTIVVTVWSNLSIFDHFNFPVLEEIHLRGAESVQVSSLVTPTVDWPKQSVFDLISRSECALRKFAFNNWLRLHDSQIHDFLDYVPSLTELEVTFNGRDALDDSFKAILADRRKGGLPNYLTRTGG